MDVESEHAGLLEELASRSQTDLDEEVIASAARLELGARVITRLRLTP